MAQDSVTVGILSILTKKILSTSARMPLSRRLAMLIVKSADIMLIVFLLTFVDMIVGILVISKSIWRNKQ